MGHAWPAQEHEEAVHTSAAAPPSPPAGDLRVGLDEVVRRLVQLGAQMAAAASAGTPGAYLLADEAASKSTRAPTRRQPALGGGDRMAELQVAFGLAPLECDLLLIAAAPELDERVELLNGYAHDDLTRRRASAGLAARLCGLGLDDAELHGALGPDAPLVRGSLLVVDDPSGPLASRPLRCPERIIRWLVGLVEPLPPLDRLIVEPPPLAGEEAERIAAAVRAGITLHYLRSPPGTDPRGIAAAAGVVLDVSTMVVALDRARPDAVEALVVIALREARLRRAILVAGPVERLLDGGATLETWTGSGWPTILHGARTWDPAWSVEAPLFTVAPPVRAADQLALWRGLLGDAAPPDDELGAVATSFRLTGEQVAVAAAAALGEATAASRPLSVEDLRRSARSRNSGALERLAKRVRPEATWNDLILPAPTLDKLHELVDRFRHRELVYETWGLAGTGNRGNGLTALFAGPSGTGKTLAAEVIAGALNLDLYVVDLSSVVDKFIGETEKNLERIFDEAERVNGVLVFDEADALFAKRSEVKDSHDRYANLETAYLLQRMEAFSGTAILTTNLRSNLDDAFARRLGAIVTFPIPDAAARLALWTRFLGPKVPVSDEVDLEFCAKFELTGANIRSVAQAASFFAAEAGPPVEIDDIIRGIEREYEKLGRLRSKAEFAPYEAFLSDHHDGA
ncbi:MAG: ATP-binding protein [Acidimicrobiales bacterium]